MSLLDQALDILAIEDILDGQGIGLLLADHIHERIVDARKADLQGRPAGNLYLTVSGTREDPRPLLDDPVSRHATSRIDSEYPQQVPSGFFL